MNVLIASDIHGSAYFCQKLIDRIEAEACDKVLLLGDILYHGPRNPLPVGYDPQKVASLLNELSGSIIAVRGNCDAEVDQMMLDFPCMGDYTTMAFESSVLLLATHGHLWNPDALPNMAGVTAFIYGHTHKKQLERAGGIAMVNPGSVSIPKDGSESYATFDGSTFTLKTLDGTVVDRMVL